MPKLTEDLGGILVVEPHPDDAFLSLGWHLESIWKERRRVVLTVFADERRAAEAKTYAERIGAESVCLGLTESKMLSGEKPRMIPELKKYLSGVEGEFDMIAVPLGLQHPDHLSCALSRTAGAVRYVDTPYQIKQKLSGELLSRAEGMRVVSIAYPPARKWRHCEVFKSQGRFFYFNSSLKESLLPEVLLES